MINYIIIALISISIIINIILLFKSKSTKNNDTIERMGKLEVNVTKEIGDFII